MKNIFDKTNLGSLQLKNRLIRSATWEALADERGHFSEEIYGIYDRLAAGGVGCIISGFTSVAVTSADTRTRHAKTLGER